MAECQVRGAIKLPKTEMNTRFNNIGSLLSKSVFSTFSKVWEQKMRYVSIYGVVLSLFVEFLRSKKIKFVKFHIFGGGETGKYGRLKNCANKMWKLFEKALRQE